MFPDKRSSRSSRSKLKRWASALQTALGLVQFLDVPVIVLVSFGIEKETVEVPQLQFFDRGRCCLGCSLEFWTLFLLLLSDSPSCGGYASVSEAFGRIYSIFRRGHVVQHLVRQ